MIWMIFFRYPHLRKPPYWTTVESTWNYPLVMSNIAIEHGNLSWIYPLKMVIFNSYVSLPEGMVWDQKYDARNLQTLALFCSLVYGLGGNSNHKTWMWEPENREQYLKGRSARVAAGSTFPEDESGVRLSWWFYHILPWIFQIWWFSVYTIQKLYQIWWV